MKIITTNTLNPYQISEIKALQEKCNEYEGLQNEVFLSNEINFYKDLPCFYLGYKEDKLVAFLTTFMPQAEEVEILAFTHPEHRMQGCFSELFQQAKDKMKCTEINKILFAIEPCSKMGMQIISNYYSLTLHHSEYRLTNTRKDLIPACEDLTLELVTKDNMKVAADITQEIFKSDSFNFVENALSSTDRELFILLLGNVPIGSFNLHFEAEVVSIYGLGIITAYQGKGYGKQLLGHALKTAFARADKVVLDVDSHNPPAFNLYIKTGFVIDFQVDYYEMKL